MVVASDVAVDRVVDEVLVRGLDDWIQAAEVVSIVIELDRGLTTSEVRAIAVAAIRKSVQSGLAALGSYEEPGGFKPWGVSADDALSRLESLWPSEGLPSLGDVCWLSNTLSGVMYANSLLSNRGSPAS